jgi:hypothetical protein
MESYPLGEGHFNRTIYLFFAELKTQAIFAKTNKTKALN